MEFIRPRQTPAALSCKTVARATREDRGRSNIQAIVVESSPCRRESQEGAYFVRMTVTDAMPGQGDHLPVLYYSSNANLQEVPSGASVGDIIMLLNVKIRRYVDAVIATGDGSTGSSFLLFRGFEGSGHTPYRSSQSNITVAAEEYGTVDVNRNWVTRIGRERFGAAYKFLRGIQSLPKPKRRIMDCHSVDLICMILYIEEQGSMGTVLYVWDGTDARPLESKRWTGSDSGAMPLEMSLWSSPQFEVPRERTRVFPTAGTVIPVVASNMLLTNNLGYHEGQWVKLEKVRFGKQNCLYEGVALPETRIKGIDSSVDRDIAASREREYDDRCQSELHYRPYWSPEHLHPITVTRHPDQRCHSLRRIVGTPAVGRRFRCTVRIMSAWPERADEFYYRNPEGESVYVIRMTLEDSTARLHVRLEGNEAVRFFGGGLATPETEDGVDFMYGLQRKMDCLLGVDPHDSSRKSRDPPWISCCLYSYFSDVDNQLNPEPLYRIFDTECVTLPPDEREEDFSP